MWQGGDFPKKFTNPYLKLDDNNIQKIIFNRIRFQIQNIVAFALNAALDTRRRYKDFPY